MVEAQLAEHLPLQERGEWLQSNCDDVESVSYAKQFTPEEISLLKNRLSEISISMNDLEEEKKEILSKINGNIKLIKKENKSLLSDLKFGSRQVTEDCFVFFDHERGLANIYNVVGSFVQSRPMKPEERQHKLFSVHNTGTND